jgi:hypothetical protein
MIRTSSRPRRLRALLVAAALSVSMFGTALPASAAASATSLERAPALDAAGPFAPQGWTWIRSTDSTFAPRGWTWIRSTDSTFAPQGWTWIRNTDSTFAPRGWTWIRSTDSTFAPQGWTWIS